MAADEVLLESAAEGLASLRFYGWSEATVSLGYFQPHRTILEDQRLAALPYVRRATGGMMLVHQHEITYALAVPAGISWQAGEPWLRRMHRIIAAALTHRGVSAALHESPDRHRDTPLCFRHLTVGDLCIEGSKVVGSAQRRQRGALLQHGGILLARSPATPELPGIRDLTRCDLDTGETIAAIRRAFEAETGWRLAAGPWTDEELARTEVLVREKYDTAAWNDRR